MKKSNAPPQQTQYKKRLKKLPEHHFLMTQEDEVIAAGIIAGAIIGATIAGGDGVLIGGFIGLILGAILGRSHHR